MLVNLLFLFCIDRGSAPSSELYVSRLWQRWCSSAQIIKHQSKQHSFCIKQLCRRDCHWHSSIGLKKTPRRLQHHITVRHENFKIDYKTKQCFCDMLINFNLYIVLLKGSMLLIQQNISICTHSCEIQKYN